MRALLPVGKAWMRLWCRLWLGPDEKGDMNAVAEDGNAQGFIQDRNGMNEDEKKTGRNDVPRDGRIWNSTLAVENGV